MTPERLTPWLIGGVMTVLLAAAVGWSLGTGAANGKTDAEAAREQGYKTGFELVFTEARAITLNRGLEVGAERGRRAGTKTGAREGLDIGAGNADIESSVEAAKAADSAASAAEAEIAARQANCGILPAAPSWCPTSEELTAYQDAVRAAREAARKAEQEKEKQNEKP